MITKLLPPKYVKRARMWCVTHFETSSKSGFSQKVDWFGTYEEALTFFRSSR